MEVVQIETEKGIIRYSYDASGNVSKKVDERGKVDTYRYN